MPPKPTDPNRRPDRPDRPDRPPERPNLLRDSVAPNTLRGFDAPAGSWLASGATRGARQGAPPTPRARGVARQPVTARGLIRLGLLLAGLGVLPFLNADVVWQEVGLGMMTGGIGMALLAASPGALRSRAAAGQGSGSSGAFFLLMSPRWVALTVTGGLLLLTGVYLLVYAATSL